MTNQSASQKCLPCVVQVGFAGSRRRSLTAEQSQFVIERLCEVLEKLPGDVGLQSHHFLCGISAIAIGADLLFTEACARLQIPQRIFLPQPRDVFLDATGSDGPDFTGPQKIEAERLLTLPHIIQERVVSDAGNRSDRFAETNREINRGSDIVVCLSLLNSTPAAATPGGTRELLQLACMSGKPVLELRLDVSEPLAHMEKHWHFPDEKHTWQPPTLPPEVANLPAPKTSATHLLPTVGEFCSAVKTHSSGQAAKHRHLFTRAAWIIVGTHLLATSFATLVLVLHGAHSPPEKPAAIGASPENAEHTVEEEKVGLGREITHGDVAGDESVAGHKGPEWFLVGLLAAELMALGAGFWTHHKLNHSDDNAANHDSEELHQRGLTHAWALARLLAEINRSVSSLGELHINLAYLFQLRLPSRFRQLLRTINVLHLVTTRCSSRLWNELKDSYLIGRLDDQQRYFQEQSERAGRHLKWAKLAFAACSSFAMVFTAAKLTILGFMWDSTAAASDQLTGALGTLAVVLPSVAVGVMSLAAAHDYEAQNYIYRQMAQWLPEQRQHIQLASSPQEFQQLVQETELRLLSETAEWYSRRAFTGVA